MALASQLLVAGEQTIELYSGTGALLSQHNASSPSTAAIGGGFAMSETFAAIFAPGNGNEIVVLDALTDHRVLATIELPAAPIGIASASAPRCDVPVAAALLADGSIAIVRMSPDGSQGAATTVSADACWGAGAAAFRADRGDAGTCRIAMVRLSNHAAAVIAFSEGQVCVLRVSPNAASPGQLASSTDLITLPQKVLAVSAARLSGPRVIVYALLRTGEVHARTYTADVEPTGGAPGEGRMFAAPLRSNATLASSSSAAFAVALSGGERLGAVSASVDSEGAVHFVGCREIVLPADNTVYAINVADSGRSLQSLTRFGVVRHALAPIAPEGAVSEGAPLTAATIATAPQSALKTLRDRVEGATATHVGSLANAAAPSDIESARADHSALRGCALALRDRERDMLGASVDTSRSAVFRLVKRLDRVALALSAVELAAFDGQALPDMQALETIRADGRAAAMAMTADSIIPVDSPAMPAAARDLWYNGPYWQPGPLVVQIALREAGLPTDKCDVATIVDALVADGASGHGPTGAAREALAFLVLYLGAGAPLGNRLDVADSLGCEAAVAHLAHVARSADTQPQDDLHLQLAARSARSVATGSALLRSLAAQCFVQLFDASTLPSAVALLPVVVDASPHQTETCSRALIRAAAVAAYASDSHSLLAIQHSFDTDAARPLWVAASATCAIHSGIAAVLEGALGLRDIDLAVDLLRFSAPVVAIQLLTSARRYSDALAEVNKLQPSDAQTRAAVSALEAHLRGLAVANPRPGAQAVFPKQGNDSDDDGNDEAADPSPAPPVVAALQPSTARDAEDCAVALVSTVRARRRHGMDTLEGNAVDEDSAMDSKDDGGDGNDGAATALSSAAGRGFWDSLARGGRNAQRTAP